MDEQEQQNAVSNEHQEIVQEEPQVVEVTSPKRGIVKKVAFITISVLVAVVLFIILLPSILNLFAKDIAPFNDSDILLSKVNVPDNQNAYFDLIKLNNDLVYEPDDKFDVMIEMIAGKIWDEQVAEEIVSRNTEAFEYFTEAARKPKFQDPAFADPANITLNTVLTPMNVWRKMSRVSAIRALYLEKQGNDKDAMDEALKSVKIGQKIQESQIYLFGYLVAMAMKSIGLETVQRIVVSSKLSDTELVDYIQELDDFYENEEGLVDSFKGEYHRSTVKSLESVEKELSN